jgi:peptidoglycan hydrolase CwlO-like protein
MKTILLALSVVFVGFATAQTTTTQKAPTKTASAPKPETKEHKFVKAQLAETQRLYDQVDAMMKEPKEDTSGYSAEQLQAHIKALQDRLELYGNLI